MNNWIWLIVGVLVVLGVLLLVMAKSSKKWNAKTLAYAALSIALSFVLSYIQFFRMPNSGSITPGSMLPIMLFAASFGIGPGMTAGLAYGILQYLQDPQFLNVWQFLLDYVIAFSALGLAGLYKHLSKPWQSWAAIGVVAAGLVGLAFAYPTKWWVFALMIVALALVTALLRKNSDAMRLMPAMTVAVLGRAVSAVCAGLIWVAMYPVPDQIPLVYSLIYNGSYLLPELAICMVMAWLVGGRVLKVMKSTAR